MDAVLCKTYLNVFPRSRSSQLYTLLKHIILNIIVFTEDVDTECGTVRRNN